jgi:hypothetical protein
MGPRPNRTLSYTVGRDLVVRGVNKEEVEYIGVNGSLLMTRSANSRAERVETVNNNEEDFAGEAADIEQLDDRIRIDFDHKSAESDSRATGRAALN